MSAKTGNDSASKTLIVATLLCIVCSVFVSWSAVSLRPLQMKNKALDIKKNLLISGGLLTGNEEEKEIIEKYNSLIEEKLVDFSLGTYVKNDPTFDAVKDAKDVNKNYTIPRKKDKACIKQRAKLGSVYFVKENDVRKKLILPVNGKGLWSTMYGFLVLSIDTKVIEGIAFYQHGETPGLGGEIENKNWLKQWIGKKLFDESWNVGFKVVKGMAAENSEYEIDGLAGATLTSNGVTALVQYWAGSDAYGPFLKNFREGIQ